MAVKIRPGTNNGTTFSKLGVVTVQTSTDVKTEVQTVFVLFISYRSKGLNKSQLNRPTLCCIFFRIQ